MLLPKILHLLRPPRARDRLFIVLDELKTTVVTGTSQNPAQLHWNSLSHSWWPYL